MYFDVYAVVFLIVDNVISLSRILDLQRISVCSTAVKIARTS